MGQEKYIDVNGQKHIQITEEGENNYIRPWSDPSHPLFAPKLLEVTRAIIEHNRESLEVMRRLASGELIEFDPSDETGIRRANNGARIPLKVRFHYMVGNHDWYYHLKGEAFDRIRQEIITALGLSNPPSPFPFDLRKVNPDSAWERDEDPVIEKLFRDYQVFGRHGDCYDSFNFDAERGRDQATLGDAFTMEVCNRYPEELKRRPDLNKEIVNNLRHITNVRPALATPLWISGQIKRLSNEHILKDASEKNIKKIWDDLGDKFINLQFVRSKDRPFKIDIVDKMQAAIQISKLTSLETLDNLVYKIQNRRIFGGDHSLMTQRATLFTDTHITRKPSPSTTTNKAATRSISTQAHGTATSTLQEKTRRKKSLCHTRRLLTSPSIKITSTTTAISKHGAGLTPDLNCKGPFRVFHPAS
jgi:hypothetical protein